MHRYELSMDIFSLYSLEPNETWKSELMENNIIIFLNCQKSFINTLNLKQVVANVRKDTKDCQTYKTEKP